MEVYKVSDSELQETYSPNDPLGIRNVVLGGQPTSLHLEAQIAYKQWLSQNGQRKDEACGGKSS